MWVLLGCLVFKNGFIFFQDRGPTRGGGGEENKQTKKVWASRELPDCSFSETEPSLQLSLYLLWVI